MPVKEEPNSLYSYLSSTSTGTNSSADARYERGANEMPVRHLIRLSKYYSVSLDYLCGLSNIKDSHLKK